MEINLLHYTPLTYCDRAISKCWNKPYDVNNVNTEKIDRVANKFKHESTIEHLNYTFEIKGVSRALLQEQARHRLASYSVKSTRYTLKELKVESAFTDFDTYAESGWYKKPDVIRASKYLVMTGHAYVDYSSIAALELLRGAVHLGISNDKAKYCIPESYKTEYMMTINARSLKNFLALRLNKAALWEIRLLAAFVYESIPEEHKFLFSECTNSKTQQEIRDLAYAMKDLDGD